MTVFSNIHTVKKTKYKQAVDGFIPNYVFVPLNQDDDEECEALVKIGDHVEEGQLLARSPYGNSLFTKNVYSPIPGTVEEFVLRPSPQGKIIKTVKISLSGTFSFIGKKIPELKLSDLSPELLTKKIGEKGILNTFKSSKPELLALQINEIRKHKSKLLVVRFFDEDPSRIIDGVITNLYLSKVLAGIRIAIRAFEPDGIVLVTDNNFEKPDIFNPFTVPTFFLKLNSKQYPVTSVRNLCQEVKKKSKSLPFTNISSKDLYTDSSTMFELHKCISKDMPVISRMVHVSGDCIPASGILNVPLGTTFESLAEQCGGLLQNPGAIIVNGIVTGFSAGSMKASVTKYVKSVTFVPRLQCPDQKQYECVRCGNCRAVCPIKLSPDIIYRHITGGQNATIDYLSSASFCTYCGLCNSTCPARLPLSQRIKEFNEKQLKKE